MSFSVLRAVAISAAAVMIGFSLAGNASAQKGNFIGEAGKPSLAFLALGPSQREIFFSSLLAGLEAGKVDGVKFKDSVAMQEFYGNHQGRAVWIDMKGGRHGRAAAILRILDKAWSHGLNPASYHADEIRNLLQSSDPSRKAALELLVSDAVTRYAQDLNGFHLPAAAIRQNASYWKEPEAAGSILSAAAASSDIEETLAAFAPRDQLYHRLRQELMALASAPDRIYEDYLPISFGGRTLQPGEIHANVVKLRARMGLPLEAVGGRREKYDDALASAVMKFQRANGLAADGVIGPRTLELLNRDPRNRMKQVIANMERLRWINMEKPERYILVNVPSATLWAVDHGDIKLEMPVIVGRPERQTKSFITEITGIRFNPKWTVPPTIKAKDFLPKLVEDPAYLQNKGIEVSAIIDGTRQTLDSSAIDWASMTRQDLAQLRMVQSAGDNNALGRIRVLMDNPYDIYLHDTNAPEYFKNPERTLSSGCIRLSDPAAVANFILAGNESWSDARMERILESGKTTEIPIAKNMPVYILYQTMWLDGQGRLVYGPDVYRQDERLIEVMESLESFHIPDESNVRHAATSMDSSIH